ncbi:hypothetical protein GCM10022222_02940 [Amycolatopsis ultiminotia]|uniref:Anti-sigma regulatory factor (Ser/Thr protein kinase) n=1 Tax=Amycolatopsis ultiminotia TaxID=543629 RepID=A0ABP6UXE4_9PSEU
MADQSPPAATMAVFAGPDTADAARTTLQAMLAHVEGPFVADAVLLLDELVTDASRDGAAHRDLRLGLLPAPPRLRIEVTRTEPPHPAPPSTLPERGWGRLLLEDLASAWSTTTNGTQATTWAELRLPG